MHTSSDLILRRVRRLLAERLVPATVTARQPLDLTTWTAPGEPVPFAEAVAQQYGPAAPGMAWGAPWSTTWFHVTGQAPADWPADDRHHVELAVDLGFSGAGPGFQAEGLVYRPDGSVVEAVAPFNQVVRLGDPRGPVDLYLEAAGNPDTTGGWGYAPTRLGVPEAMELDPIYELRHIDLALVDQEAWELVADVVALQELAIELPETDSRRARILRALDLFVDVIDPEDVVGTIPAGRASLAEVLAQPAHASAHEVVAVGHAHIDSAWLWPTRETVRKCARTFSNVLALMDEDPDFTFACSSAQQYAWVKAYYPDVFARIQQRAAEGRWVPVGSMWVESDTNMPGGEAFARQLVAGKRFFLEELGVETRDVWLPDSFGYSGALPQLARLAGAQWFLSQKLSWNETDRMPHHSFWWEGIDGTRVFTHFPPVDTYNSDLSARQLRHAEANFEEKAVSTASIVPFGYGDGGGGPNREMLARARRYADLEGVPRVRLGSPNEFYAQAQAEAPADLGTWSGEMYLEFHRGTYTSQARTKRGNRRSEHLLREAELWAATAASRAEGAEGYAYPYDLLEEAWRTVLLNQFHDILPGSSIGWVYRVAEADYARVEAQLEQVIAEAVAAVAGTGDRTAIANARPHGAGGVAAGAIGAAVAPDGAADVVVTPGDGGAVLDNGLVRVVVDGSGLVTSMVDAATGREAIAPGMVGNLLSLHRDVPRQWDAWDTDVEHRRVRTDLTDADAVEVSAEGGETGSVTVRRSVGASTIEQTLSLHRGRAALEIVTDIDWHERQKLLKLGFALDVHADRSAAETQFGHVFRSTHTNTSWDAARFEICAHRWVHVGEPGFGVAVANDAVYGHDITRVALPQSAPEVVPNGTGGPLPVTTAGTATVVRQSLLKAPMFPDPEADQGRHRFTTLVHAGAGIAEAVADGYVANLPTRTVSVERDVAPLVHVEGDGVVVEAVKLAEDRSGDLVVRLYESLGAHTSAVVTTDVAHRRVAVTDLLERDLPTQDLDGDAAGTRLRLRPFEVRTLRFRSAG